MPTEPTVELGNITNEHYEYNYDLLSNRRHTSPISVTNNEKNNEIIKHKLLEALGQSTNLIIYSLFQNTNEKLTREAVRQKLETHKNALGEQGLNDSELARIKTGKATTNYWIDYFVEKGLLIKKNSNPVLFWINNKNRVEINPLFIPPRMNQNTRYVMWGMI